MARIIDSEKHVGRIRVVVDENNIYFIEKSSAIVYASNGSLFLEDADRTLSVDFIDVVSPKWNTLDELVVDVREMIDNV